VESFTVDAAYAPATKFKMTRLTVPKSARHNRKFNVSVKVLPRYNSLGSPIKFQIQRKSGRRWRTYATARSEMTVLAQGYTKFGTSLKIKRKSTYRIRARFSDAAHARYKYTGYKAIKIK
jgi:hypothetical protein